MTMFRPVRPKRSAVARAAIVGTTRALNADFVITQDAPPSDRIAKALTALMTAEPGNLLLSVGVVDCELCS